jgi:hypothetical protein
MGPDWEGRPLGDDEYVLSAFEKHHNATARPFD